MKGRVCPSIKFECISTIIPNHGTGFLGPNQTNNSFGTQSKLRLANSIFEFADYPVTRETFNEFPTLSLSGSNNL